jgi:acyl carrier protein
VKIRGFRIELGEIETRLRQNRAVREALVVCREDVPGDRRLVVYLTSRDHAPLSIPGLRSSLRETLPDYMVPGAFVVMDQLPLTQNGKIDRRSLPAPDSVVRRAGECDAPEGEIERTLAKIWEELLAVKNVGREADFFALGGHSLSATQLIVRIRASFSLQVPIRTVFEAPTLRALGERIQSLQDAQLDARIAVGGGDMEKLLRRVAAMSDDAVVELTQKKRTEGRL